MSARRAGLPWTVALVLIGLAFWPGLTLAIVIYGVNMLGDALRDLLDPRLRSNVGRIGLPKKK